ncbi:MAG: glycosyltransferase family 39 protein [Thermodesulfobacteriota bacterium]|nr:glycosyltransferase family 39 protein [Thermodesulfobacteriota bacterium]
MLSFSKYFKILLIGLLISLSISIIILSYVPPVSRDALTHHLAVPKLYLKHGGIYEVPELEFSYYPMNLDLLYLIPLSFGNDIIPKFIHFSFALMTAWLIFNYMKKRIDTCHALFGVILFLSLPLIIKLSITVYVDHGLIFFSTASIICLLKWIEKDFSVKYLIYSAIWCGLALGTKYNGLIVFFLLTLFVPFLYLRCTHDKTSRQLKAIGYGATFLFISLLIFSPWMIRNTIWTGNPIYPLYDNLIYQDEESLNERDGSCSTNSTKSTSITYRKKPNERLGPFGIRRLVYDEKWWETAAIPARIFFQGKDNHPKYFDGRLNPYLFILPFFAFIKIRWQFNKFKTEKKILLTFALLFLLYTFMKTDMRIRYISPILPSLVILSVFGLNEIVAFINDKYPGTTGKKIKGIFFAFMAFLLSLNIAYIISQFRIVEPISYISGRVERNKYIEKYRPEYATINYANLNLPVNAKILCLFLGHRGYYFDRKIAFSFDLVSKEILREHSSEKILIELEGKGITHVLARYDLFSKWLQDSYSDKEKEVVKIFFKTYTSLIFSKNGHGLYQLKKQMVEDG